MWWIVRTLAVGIGKAVTLGEYERIKKENKKASDYGILVIVMNEVVAKRLITCKVESGDCPSATVIPQFYQPGRTTSGTAPLRIYTIRGSDGQWINIQMFDLSETIKVTVQHTGGTEDLEEVEPSEALKRIEREAGYHPHAAAAR